MDITFVNGNSSWKFRDDTMRETYWKSVKTGGRMDRQIDERTEVFLEPLGLS